MSSITEHFTCTVFPCKPVHSIFETLVKRFERATVAVSCVVSCRVTVAQQRPRPDILNKNKPNSLHFVGIAMAQ